MRPSFTAALLSVTLVGIAGGQEQELREEEKTLNQWIEKLEHKDVEVRRSAAKALQKMGPGAKEAVPVLIKALQDKDELVRTNAAFALGRVGPEAEQAVPNLIKALEDEDRNVRVIAVQALGSIGPEAKQSVPAFTRALQDEKYKVRTSATRALWLIRVGTREARKTGTFPHGKVKDGLAAFLFCHKNRFEVGEPIPLTHGIILVGPGLQSRDAEAHKLKAKVRRPLEAVDPGNGSWFEVTGPDGARVSYEGGYIDLPYGPPLPSDTAVLGYREFLGRNHQDLCEQGTFDLSKPGRYMVRWCYGPREDEGLWAGKLISNEVQFEIVADSAADGCRR